MKRILLTASPEMISILFFTLGDSFGFLWPQGMIKGILGFMPNFEHPPLNNVRNVLGTSLTSCSHDPVTGYMRDSYCRRIPGDQGEHVICAVMTEAFLKFSTSRGNDLSTPIPAYEFPGLRPGDHWCLCLRRWIEAMEAGMAPLVDLEATHENVLEWVDLQTLEKYKL